MDYKGQCDLSEVYNGKLPYLFQTRKENVFALFTRYSKSKQKERPKASLVTGFQDSPY